MRLLVNIGLILPDHISKSCSYVFEGMKSYGNSKSKDEISFKIRWDTSAVRVAVLVWELIYLTEAIKKKIHPNMIILNLSVLGDFS